LETIKHLIDFILHIDKYLVQITSEYRGWTYLILFIIIFAETGFVITPFLPGDSLLFATAALIAGGNSGLNIYELGLILIVAAFAGNTVNYLLGNYLGPKVFKEHNKVLKLKYYTDTQAFFDRHGGKAVILSRFMPIIRTIAPFVAGVGRMPLVRYSLYNIIGGASWIILFLFAGYQLGNMAFFKTHFSIVEIIIILVSVIPAFVAFAKGRASKKAAVN
jgi:membrane-associated protein